MARKDSNHDGLGPGSGFSRAAGRTNPGLKIAAGAAFDAQGRPTPAIHSMLLKAVEVQRPLVLANLRRLRNRHPHATAFELSQRLERDFLAGVGTGGAAIGATAIIPGVGTVAALSISAAATVVFLEATALYAQSVAELHGIRLQDPAAAQVTVMAIILGDEGIAMLQGLTGHALGTGKTPLQTWGKTVTKSLPLTAVRSLIAPMRKKFLRKMAIKGSASVVGKALPFGVGAVVGGVGNYMMGRAVIASAQRAFGPAPMMIPAELLAELEAAPTVPKALKGSQVLKALIPSKKRRALRSSQTPKASTHRGPTGPLPTDTKSPGGPTSTTRSTSTTGPLPRE